MLGAQNTLRDIQEVICVFSSDGLQKNLKCDVRLSAVVTNARAQIMLFDTRTSQTSLL